MPCSNVKNERTNFLISFWKQNVWYPSRMCLVKKRLFRFGPESAVLDKIDIALSMGQIREQTQTFWFHSC
jgi:hypothetical protein